MKRSKWVAGLAIAAAGALMLSACSSDSGDKGDTGNNGDTPAAAESYKIGVAQLVQHPALDAANEGFKQALKDAGLDVTYDDQNANGEQSTAVTIAQNFASGDYDLVLAIATPVAQAMAQAVTDKPVLFTAVTDAVAAQIVASNEAPGANVTGTSDAAPMADQFDLIKQFLPDVKTIGTVYSSAEANSQVQAKQAQEIAASKGFTLVEKTVTTANEIPQATEALGDVDAIYIFTDSTVVAGLASLVQVAEAKQIPVFGAEAGTVESGAIATLGLDYKQLGYQTGQMAVKILTQGANPATMPVEFAAPPFTYTVNEGAAQRMGVTIPADILSKADKVG